MDNKLQIANLYIASLKGLSLIHQHNHWSTKGKEFYADHLLFERLYKSVLENLDAAAEKCIGIFGDSALNYELQAKLLNGVLIKFDKFEGSPVQMSLAAEQAFIKLSQSIYNDLSKSGDLTLGLDDLIMSICNDREGGVYLLKQVLKD